jgi:hypothetical protein
LLVAGCWFVRQLAIRSSSIARAVSDETALFVSVAHSSAALQGYPDLKGLRYDFDPQVRLKADTTSDSAVAGSWLLVAGCPDWFLVPGLSADEQVAATGSPER